MKLILFDHHSDMELSSSQRRTMISCGSWVSFALRNNPMLQKAIIIGPPSFQIHSLISSKVKVFPIKSTHAVSVNTILSHIETNTVYMSIDKDILEPRDAITNWDQGHMDLSKLLQYVRSIKNKKSVHGIDICGEISSSPTEMFLPEYQEAITKNKTANIQILESILQIPKQYSHI
ncbi:arginase family protein [Bacillus bingmayongensis]|uniref:arginase family protein n=1 Tax=Bacillus bingmayongensis TaxID=1150157 RepID=UPI0028BD1A45|nr:arginase family protein [Bacillus bingmayongensis]